MTTARAPVGGVGNDGRIYAIGDSFSEATEVQALNPQTGMWENVAPLPTGRRSLSGVAGPDGKIYVVGGLDVNANSLSTVEVYDPAIGSWTP